jgi:hypothetical protein
MGIKRIFLACVLITGFLFAFVTKVAGSGDSPPSPSAEGSPEVPGLSDPEALAWLEEYRSILDRALALFSLSKEGDIDAAEELIQLSNKVTEMGEEAQRIAEGLGAEERDAFNDELTRMTNEFVAQIGESSDENFD